MLESLGHLMHGLFLLFILMLDLRPNNVRVVHILVHYILLYTGRHNVVFYSLQCSTPLYSTLYLEAYRCIIHSTVHHTVLFYSI